MKKPLTPEQAEALYLLAKRIVDKKTPKHSKQLTIYDSIERYEKEHKQ